MVVIQLLVPYAYWQVLPLTVNSFRHFWLPVYVCFEFSFELAITFTGVTRQFSMGHSCFCMLYKRAPLLWTIFSRTFVQLIVLKDTVSPFGAKGSLGYSLRGYSVSLQSKKQTGLPYTLRDLGALSLKILSCNTTHCFCRYHLPFFTLSCGKWGSRNGCKKMLTLLIPLLLWVIKSFVSDPGVPVSSASICTNCKRLTS